MPQWVNISKRKSKSYAVFGAMVRILNQAVMDEGSEEAEELFHSVFGSIEAFDEVIYEEVLKKVDQLEKRLERNSKVMKLNVLADFDDFGSESDIEPEVTELPEETYSVLQLLGNLLKTRPELEVAKLATFHSSKEDYGINLHPGRILERYNIDIRKVGGVEKTCTLLKESAEHLSGEKKHTRMLRFRLSNLDPELRVTFIDILKRTGAKIPKSLVMSLDIPEVSTQQETTEATQQFNQLHDDDPEAFEETELQAGQSSLFLQLTAGSEGLDVSLETAANAASSLLDRVIHNSPPQNAFICKECKIPFEFKMEMIEHIEKEHPSAQVSTQTNNRRLDVSLETAAIAASSLIETVIHNSPPPTAFICKECKIPFEFKMEMIEHMKKEHPSAQIPTQTNIGARKKRPMNCFLHYLAIMRPQLRKTNPTLNHQQLTKKLR